MKTSLSHSQSRASFSSTVTVQTPHSKPRFSTLLCESQRLQPSYSTMGKVSLIVAVMMMVMVMVMAEDQHQENLAMPALHAASGEATVRRSMSGTHQVRGTTCNYWTKRSKSNGLPQFRVKMSCPALRVTKKCTRVKFDDAFYCVVRTIENLSRG